MLIDYDGNVAELALIKVAMIRRMVVVVLVVASDYDIGHCSAACSGRVTPRK